MTIASPPVTPAPPGKPLSRLARLLGMRVRIVVALLLAFVAVAAIATIAFGLAVGGASETTQRLLLDRNRRLLDNEVGRVQEGLAAVGERLQFVAGLAAQGRIDVNVPSAVEDALAVAFERLPNVRVVAFIGLDERVHRIVRQGQRMVRESRPLADLPGATERFRKLREAHQIYWGDLFWAADLGGALFNVRMPIRDDTDTFMGGLVATVTLGDLSRALTDADTGGDDASFILAGRDRVLAHRRLIDPQGLELGPADPLPRLDAVGDPVLAAIWQPPDRSERFDRSLRGIGHIALVDGRRWVFLYRQIEGFGEPWFVGRYFPLEVATRDLERLRQGMYGGGAALVFALLLAAFMGLRMAGSVRDLGRAAEHLARLEFDAAPAGRSRLRELDDAGAAMGRAQQALRWFGLYVPHRLVSRLMEEGEETLRSQRRTVTVMFTDIVGFTPQAEDMDEIGSAELLNRHFELLGPLIDQEHGVIDKYIGDAVMAVWGGIRRMPDHADAACRAAIAIAQAIRTDNQRRRTEGQDPIRLRIGVHTGPVTVGNIGAPGRINYTVVGDTVNVAQRLEQLGKQHMQPADDVIVLGSAATIEALQDPSSLGVEPVFVGEQVIRGRQEPLGVFRLV